MSLKEINEAIEHFKNSLGQNEGELSMQTTLAFKLGIEALELVATLRKLDSLKLMGIYPLDIKLPSETEGEIE